MSNTGLYLQRVSFWVLKNIWTKLKHGSVLIGKESKSGAGRVPRAGISEYLSNPGQVYISIHRIKFVRSDGSGSGLPVKFQKADSAISK